MVPGVVEKAHPAVNNLSWNRINGLGGRVKRFRAGLAPPARGRISGRSARMAGVPVHHAGPMEAPVPSLQGKRPPISGRWAWQGVINGVLPEDHLYVARGRDVVHSVLLRASRGCPRGRRGLRPSRRPPIRRAREGRYPQRPLLASRGHPRGRRGLRPSQRSPIRRAREGRCPQRSSSGFAWLPKRTQGTASLPKTTYTSRAQYGIHWPTLLWRPLHFLNIRVVGCARKE
jgi:hypothetical protein